MIWSRWNGRTRQYIGDFCFDIELLKADGGYYKLPLAWGSDDITAVRAAAKKGIANMQTLGFAYRENRYTITSTGNDYIKLQAINSEKEWYKRFFIDSQSNVLSEEDNLFLQDLQRSIDSYYNRLIKFSFINGISLKTIIPFYKLSRKFNVPFISFVKYIILALLTK